MDISLAGWLLSLISFIVGTIIPSIYYRYSYDEISVKQLSVMTSLAPEKYSKTSEFYMTIIFKIVNARNNSIIIDKITAENFIYKGEKIIPLEIDGLYIHDINKPLRIPIDHDLVKKNIKEILPIIITANTENIYRVDVYYDLKEKYKKIKTYREIASNAFNPKRINLSMRINGKYKNINIIY
jgi:hypothetical protein